MKEPWEIPRGKFNLADLSDQRLGSLYRDWAAMSDYTIGAYPDSETLTVYAEIARVIINEQGTDAGNLARFARVRLACGAMGYGLASAESAYKNGKDYADFHYLVIRRALADGRAVPPDVLADYADLVPASLSTANDAGQAGGPAPAAVLPSGPMLSNGKPRAPLPEALAARLKPRHVLIHQSPPDNPRCPFYSDGDLVIYGSWPDYWIACWLSRPPDTMPSILLWQGELNLDIVWANTPEACAAALCEHLAAWRRTVEIVLADSPMLLDGRPRAPLPLTLYQRLRAVHTLTFYSDDEHPCYRDDLLMIMGTRYLLDEWSWVVHYQDPESGPLPLGLWRGESGLKLIGASTAESCLIEFQAHLAAWGRQVNIVLEAPPAPGAQVPVPPGESRKRPATRRKSGPKKERQLALI